MRAVAEERELDASWTAADAAELDVLLYELTRAQEHHRSKCRACQPCAAVEAWRAHRASCPACRGDAPLTYGPPCERRHAFVEHGADCVACHPCTGMTKVIAVVVDWFEVRRLLSKAEWLRAVETARAAA